jgi:hypothetical protein
LEIYGAQDLLVRSVGIQADTGKVFRCTYSIAWPLPLWRAFKGRQKPLYLVL